jgi:hypothetical protein
MPVVAGKFVGEDTPDVEYSANDRDVPGAVERVNPAPAVGDTVRITPRRKAPLGKATEEDVDIEVPVPLPVAPAPLVVIPETS